MIYLSPQIENNICSLQGKERNVKQKIRLKKEDLK